MSPAEVLRENLLVLLGKAARALNDAGVSEREAEHTLGDAAPRLAQPLLKALDELGHPVSEDGWEEMLRSAMRWRPVREFTGVFGPGEAAE